jgi:hypothetical protein
MTNIKRVRPRQFDTVTESIKLLLDLPLDLSQATREDLSEALGRFAPPETWGFVMLNPDQQRLVLKAINKSERPMQTLRVWNAAISHIRYDTGEIMAGRKRLSEDTETSPQDVSKALSYLTGIGALVRLKPGRYAINPHVGWQGSLLKREAQAKKTPLVVVGK